jgi:hypothetical protein
MVQDDTVVPWRNIQEVPRDFKLIPRGGTPLLDSVARSIRDLGYKLASMREEDRPTKVIVIVQTDGEENSSRETSLEKLKAMVDHQRQKYNWDFMFLGADIDAFGYGASLGFASAATASYGNNWMGYQSVAVNLSAAIGRSRDALAHGIVQDVTYTTEEQEQMKSTLDSNLPTTP